MMPIEFDQIIRILKNTPEVLSQTLYGMSPELLNANEGPNTWSPYQVVGHLIHGEKTDWVPRIKIILGEQSNKSFTPYDRFAQNRFAQDSIATRLDQFKALRNENIRFLLALPLGPTDFLKTGQHPELGEVTLANLLSTWAVHDLSHIVQINRTLARQFKHQMGPWPAYFSLLKNS